METKAMTQHTSNRYAALVSFLLVLAAVLTGCTVGPNYKRPAVDVPTLYRQPAEDNNTTRPAQNGSNQPAPSGAAAPNGPVALGEEKWFEVFQDKQLQGLIATALKNNYDVRIAATRVLQAQAQLGITRADQLPSLSAGGTITAQQNPKSGPIPAFEITRGQLDTSASWNLDFWGRYRRATEAARANLLASEWGQKAVMSSLVASVAADYFLLRQLDHELEIAKRTLSSREDSLQLIRTLEEHGINSMLDVRQAEQLVYTAAAQIPDLERLITQEENAISVLLGNNPGDVPRGLQITEEPHAPEVPVGIPSALLERRPDIRLAEQNLIVVNAQIGVARAAYFPSISLTGSGGYESTALANLFTGPAGAWSLLGQFSQPIFSGGRLKSNVRLAEAQRDQLLLTYQQTIQGAFRDVSNALVAYRKNREFRIQQEHLVEAAQDAAHLSEVRFKVGTTDYLEVLTNNTNYFSAELTLAQAQGNELTALVQLYQALGGGWQQ
jgi:outer membrane protein, multidrug efflux system